MTPDTAPLTADGGKPPRQRLLEAACELFCRYGINAIGVDTVVARAGTAKATLYKIFGSKENLVEAVLEREGCAWRNWFLAGLENGAGTPAARLRRVFPLLGEWFAQEHFYGCPFINAVAEHDKRNDRLRSIAMKHKLAVLTRIEDLAREAGAADPVLFAHQYALLIDGAIVAAMVTRDPSIAPIAAGAAERLLSELGGGEAQKRTRRQKSPA